MTTATMPIIFCVGGARKPFDEVVGMDRLNAASCRCRHIMYQFRILDSPYSHNAHSLDALVERVAEMSDGGGFLCGQDSFHPYECNHDETCHHCTNAQFEGHDPAKCWLCCDGNPATQKPMRMVDQPYQPWKKT